MSASQQQIGNPILLKMGGMDESFNPTSVDPNNFVRLIGLYPFQIGKLKTYPGKRFLAKFSGQQIKGVFDFGNYILIQTDTQLVRYSKYELEGEDDPEPPTTPDPPIDAPSPINEEDLDMILLKYRVAGGTVGASLPASTRTTVPLNLEEVDLGPNCSLAANQFTLSAGAYPFWVRYKHWVMIAGNPATGSSQREIKFQTFLRNVTAGADVSESLSGRLIADGATAVEDSADISFCETRFEVTASTVYCIQAWASRDCVMGTPVTSGGQEVYAMVEMLIEP